jgi:pimeloyl-ACP methyl ester carboxylesterase
MMRIERRLATIGIGLGLSICFAMPRDAVAAVARDQWQVLPATPMLPQADKSGFSSVNGIRIWYSEYGVHNRGVPVLLLHGGLASSNYFGHLIPVLVRCGYRVIAADSRGQGRSTRSTEPLSYGLMASDTLALMDRLKLRKVDLVGWSDGGIIGLNIALTNGDRLNRLFAFGANADPSGTNQGLDKNPVFAEYLRRTREEYVHLSVTPTQYGELLAQIETMWLHEPRYTREQLTKISIPVTIADGQYDEAIRSEHDVYMAEVIPRANVVFLPNVSHFAMLQNPAEFADAILAFLKYR